jgi:hypothetical protein
MRQTIDEHCGGSDEEPYRLITAEEAALLVAASFPLLLDAVAL